MPALSRFSGLLICCLLSSTASAQSAKLQRCMSIDDNSARLACYDKALGRDVLAATDEPAAEVDVPAELPAPVVQAPAAETVSEPAQQPFIRQTEMPPVPAETAAAPTAFEPEQPAEPVQTEAEFGLPQETDWEEVKDDRITASIIDVDRTPFGSTIVELDNNHVWQQVDDKRLTLRKGDEVTIRGGMGGSYYLAKTSGSRSLKVKRIK
jgi:hypothetical protein